MYFNNKQDVDVFLLIGNFTKKKIKDFLHSAYNKGT